MSWLRIDDKFGQHPKVLGLTDREFRVHVLTLCYCAEYGTDGVIHRASWRTLGITQPIADSLVAAGVWDLVENVYKAHDFRKYNPKDATSADRKERYRERKRNGEGTQEERKGNDEGTFLTRAQPVPSLPFLKQNQQQQGPSALVAADTNSQLHQILDTIDVTGGLRVAAFQDQARALACATKARAEATTNPAGLFRRLFESGEWPTAPTPPPRANVPIVDNPERLATMIRNGAMDADTLEVYLAETAINGETADELRAMLDASG